MRTLSSCPPTRLQARPASRPSICGLPAAGRRCLASLGLLSLLVCAPAASVAAVNQNEVIVPNASVEKVSPSAHGVAGSGTLTFVGVFVLAGVGAWLLWRGRGGRLATLARSPRNLLVEETRSLGNRQYLVVATYQDKKFLLGVCPGRIDLLSPLHETPAPVLENSRS